MAACTSVAYQADATPKSSTADANGQGELLFIGDSLTVGTNAFGSPKVQSTAIATWTKVTIDAKVGRKASVGADVLARSLTKKTTAIVIALGTNDMISRTETWYPRWVIDTVMMNTNNQPTLWINLKFSPTGRGDWRLRATRFNTELRRAQTRWPNLYIANWNKFFNPTSKSRFIADGVHLTVSGYKTRSAFLNREILAFGNAIIDATTSTSTTTTSTTPVAPTSSTSTSTTTSTTSSSTSTTSSTTTTVTP